MKLLLLVVFGRMLFQTVLVFGRHELSATVFEHIVRVPGGGMFISRMSAGAFVEQLAHIRGIFHPFFSLAGTRTVLRFLPGACGTGLCSVRHILPDQQRGPFGSDVLSRHEKSLLIPSLCIEFQNLIDEIGQNGELVGIGGQVNFAKLDGVQENGYCGDRTVLPVHFFGAGFQCHHRHSQVMHRVELFDFTAFLRAGPDRFQRASCQHPNGQVFGRRRVNFVPNPLAHESV